MWQRLGFVQIVIPSAGADAGTWEGQSNGREADKQLKTCCLNGEQEILYFNREILCFRRERAIA